MATLGKRTRSSTVSNASNKSRSSSPIPPSKRFKTKAVTIQLADDSNKENVCPEGWQGFSSVRPLEQMDIDDDADPDDSFVEQRRTRSASAVGRVDTPINRTHSLINHLHDTLTPPPTPTACSPNLSSLSTARSNPIVASIVSLTPPQTPEASHQTRARALLRLSLSSSEGSISGRDSERTSILSFLYPFLRNDDSVAANSLYISGSPGTGKTFLVTDVLRSLSLEYPSLTATYVNCMGLNEQNLWERLLEALEKNSYHEKGGKGRKLDVAGRLRNVLQSIDSKCILVLDELDALPKPLRHTLFTLPSSFSNTLRLIGISNDLTIAPTSTATLHFPPYTPQQIIDIVRVKLEHVEIGSVVQPQALTFLAKKIAASTGDMRAAMQVLSRALDKYSSTTTGASPVGMKDILDALRRCTAASSNTGSPTSSVVRDLGLQARLVLTAFLVARRRLGADLPLTISASSKSPKNLESTSPTKLYSLYTSILTSPPAFFPHTITVPFSPVSRNEFTDLLGILETSSIVTILTCSSPTRGKGKIGKMAGGEGILELAESVREEEVVKGLTNAGEGSGGVKEEEIKRLWERELWRIGSELKARGRQNAGSVDTEMMGFSQ